ncbi:hypothetical protein BOQ64_23185, partial [Chryseobacterium sp. CH25]
GGFIIFEAFSKKHLDYVTKNEKVGGTETRLTDQYVRKGGFIIFEAFSKKHLDYVTKNEKVGGTETRLTD